MLLGGAVLGCLYKAANTMDSMVGYKNERYLDFGRTAARLDDALNFIPARLCAWVMIFAAQLCGMDAGNALRIYRRDKRNHASPNSAHTEAVMAGALRVRLAGNAYYFGKLCKKPYIGDAQRPIEAADIQRAHKLLYVTAYLLLMLLLAFRGFCMLRYEHGGDVYGTADAALDFSVNVNPLGMPNGVKHALISHAAEYARYPDPKCRVLCAALADRHGLMPEQVLCGNGAADLIFRIAACFRPKRALVPAPAFSEYERAVTAFGGIMQEHLLSEANGFALTEEFLKDITPETGLVFLCTPNNPTGRLIDPDLIRNIADACRKNGAILVLDECFIGFTEGKSMAQELGNYPNLIILSAFTKLYAMAGLPVGISACGERCAACAHRSVWSTLERFRPRAGGRARRPCRAGLGRSVRAGLSPRSEAICKKRCRHTG